MFDILPSTCLVIHVLHYGTGKFTGRAETLNNHRLYQIDNVFLYPSVMDRIYFKVQQNLFLNLVKWKHNPQLHKYILKLSYFYGRFLTYLKIYVMALNVTDKI